MKDWYYQIKGKSGTENNNEGYFGGHSNWVFPPIFSGKVTAENKDIAKQIIESEYSKKFPLRVAKKDLDSNDFLLSIKEIKDNRTKSLFDIKNCKQCDTEFRQIDLYNDANQTYKGSEYCCHECKNESYEVKRFEYSQDKNMQGYHQPVIYKVTNKNTKLCYIGKTTQAFTLRWYQHFYQGSGTNFHLAIKDSKLTDWTFEIVEVIIIEKDKYKTSSDVEKYIFERERHYINYYDSKANGYNTQ